jgi:hypothetical protein
MVGGIGCGKTRLACHSEESRSHRDDEESGIVLKLLRARFLASLGMTGASGGNIHCEKSISGQQRDDAAGARSV